MEFRCLGPLEVRGLDGVPVDLGGPQQRLVLALLLVHVNTVVSTDRLVDSIWGESPPETARKTIQGYVSALRKVLPAGSTLESHAPGYLLEVKPAAIDSHRFEKAAAEGARKVTGDPHEATTILDGANSLWRGRPYEDLGDAASLQPEIVRLQQLHEVAVEARVAADLFAGHAHTAVAELDDLTSRFPLRERLWALRMLALYRTGRQADALRVFDEAKGVLAEEVGLEPGSELRLLEQRVLDQDPVLDTMAALEPASNSTETAQRNPYKGLRAFEEADTDDFYGRAALIRRLREALGRRRGARLVVLAGPSGSGKSSVVRAGLIPVLRNQGTDVVIMYPGSTPAETLSAAVDRLDVAPASVLVIDQLEELFTLAPAEDRAAFLDGLAAIATGPSGPWVLVAVRADFLDHVLAHARFANLVEPALVLVTPLADHEVREVVVGPASRVGVTAEPELVAAAVSLVASRPSTLPLLEFALTDLYDRTGGGTMTLAALEGAGGISGALVKRAEEIYEALSEVDRESTRQLFLRLVTLAEDGEPLRRRVVTDDLVGLPRAADVMDVFGEYRLLTFDRIPSGRPTVEVAHEVLLREWPRLADWIDRARLALRRHRQLDEASSDWEDHDRAAAYLLGGSLLARYADWSDNDLALNESEAAFLDASRTADEDRRSRERRRRRLVRAGFGAAAAVAITLGVAALVAWNDARAKDVLADQGLANDLNAAAQSAIERDPELAILLSLQSLATNPSSDTPLHHKTTLREAMEADILVARHAVAGPGDLLTMDLASDGSALAYWTPGELHLIDPDTWDTRWSHADETLSPDPMAPTTVGAPVFSPDGRFVAIGTTEEVSRLIVLESANGSTVAEVEFAAAPCGGAHTGPQSWSADGRYIGVMVNVDCFGPDGDSSLRIVDSETWEVATEIPVFGQAVFAEHAPRMAAIEYPNNQPDRLTFIYDTETFEIVAEFGATSGDFRPDGRAFAAANPDGQTALGAPVIDLYDLDAGAVTDRFTGLSRRPTIYATEFIPTIDGYATIVGTDGHTTGLWNAQNGSLIRLLPTGAVNSLGYDEAAQLLYTASTSGSIEVWDLSPGGQMAPDTLVSPYWFEANWFSVNPGSRTGVAMHWGSPSDPIQSFAAFNTTTGSLGATLIEEIAHHRLLALPDDRALFLKGDWASGLAGPVAVWDAATGEVTDFLGCETAWHVWETGPDWTQGCLGGEVLSKPTGPIVASADGTELLAMDVAGIVHVWDASSLEYTSTLDVGPVKDGPAEVVAAARDWILVLAADRAHVAFDRSTLKVLGEFEFAVSMNLEVADDGSFLVMRHFDTSIYRVDTDNWEPRLLFSPGQFVRGLALSPDHNRLMLGGTDGFVRILDAATGDPLDQVPFEHVSDGYWIDDGHIVVGTGSTGTWGIIILDFSEVVANATGQLTRSFTAEECRTYRIDPCPTLLEIRLHEVM